MTAGTPDVGPALGAVRVLHWSDIEASPVTDVGVAGLWRLLDRVEERRQADVLIVSPGLDSALPRLVEGRAPGSVTAVPTSAGYGVAAGERAALHAALASRAPGVTVVSIGNGHGAACAALRPAAHWPAPAAAATDPGRQREGGP